MIPERYAPHVYPIFRFVVGLLFLFHGLQKFGLLGGNMVPLMSRVGAAAVIELVCGALVAAGLFTRPAAFVASGQMAVAYFLFISREASGRFRTRENWQHCTASPSCTSRHAAVEGCHSIGADRGASTRLRPSFDLAPASLGAGSKLG